MFITKEELKVLQQLIEPNDTDYWRDKYRRGDFPRADRTKDVYKRYRWDLLHAAGQAGRDWIGTIYDRGGHDAHMDTALRQVVAPL